MEGKRGTAVNLVGDFVPDVGALTNGIPGFAQSFDLNYVIRFTLSKFYPFNKCLKKSYLILIFSKTLLMTLRRLIGR